MYGFSTIAASDFTIGCFVDREPDFVRAFKVHAPFGEKNRKLDVFDTDDTIWQSIMDNTPLSRHASAFRERMLPPRVLWLYLTEADVLQMSRDDCLSDISKRCTRRYQ